MVLRPASEGIRGSGGTGTAPALLDVDFFAALRGEGDTAVPVPVPAPVPVPVRLLEGVMGLISPCAPYPAMPNSSNPRQVREWQTEQSSRVHHQRDEVSRKQQPDQLRAVPIASVANRLIGLLLRLTRSRTDGETRSDTPSMARRVDCDGFFEFALALIFEITED